MSLILAFIALLTTLLQNPPSASEMVHIDGKKNPEMIPEYVVWQQALSGFAIVKSKGLSLPPILRKLTPAEREQLFETVKWHEQQEKDCITEQQRKTEMLRSHKKPDWKAIDAVQKAVILECREEVLDRVAVLLGKISDDSRIALLAYGEESKAGIWATVPKSELEFFKKPR